MQLQHSLSINSRNPQWWLSMAHLLRSLGYSSFIRSMISFIIYYYRRYIISLRQSLGRGVPTKSIRPSGNRKLLSSARPNSSALDDFGNRLLDTFRIRKRIVISVKNTLLWNPSADIKAPNHAFKENAIKLIQQLSAKHHVYLLLHFDSDEERQQVQHIFDRNTFISNAIQSEHILFCGSLGEKLDCLDDIRPDIYVEGGSEHENGWETIQILLNEYANIISRIIWVTNGTSRAFLDYTASHHPCNTLNEKVERVVNVIQSSIASLS